MGRLAVKQLNHPKLLIGKLKYSYMSLGGQDAFYPLNMYIGIFPAGAVPHINTELEHLEPIVQ